MWLAIEGILHMNQKQMIMVGINLHINLSAGGFCFYTCLDGIFQQVGKYKAQINLIYGKISRQGNHCMKRNVFSFGKGGIISENTVNSLSRAVNALITADLHITENELWFRTGAGIFYNVICLLFVLAAWYPTHHRVQTMIADENFAQTWYVFWILPVIFIGVNLFMIPKYRSTLYTGRVLQCYIVLSLVLLITLLLFYVMFLMMAISLNRNAKLQQENHFLSLQQERYENLYMAIEEARQARHDIRHHFVQLSSLAEQGDMEKIKKYLLAATGKISDYNLHF